MLMPLDQYPVIDYQPAKQWELMIISIAVFSTIILFLSFIIDFSVVSLFVIYVSFLAVMYFSYLFDYGALWNSLMAFFAATLFPCLAIISQFPQNVISDDWVQRVLKMFVYLIKLLGICMIGAFFIVSFLSDLTYILNVTSFGGVKFSFILPLFIIGLFFYLSPHRISSLMFVFRRLYYAPVRTQAYYQFYLLVYLYCC